MGRSIKIIVSPAKAATPRFRAMRLSLDSLSDRNGRHRSNKTKAGKTARVNNALSTLRTGWVIASRFDGDDMWARAAKMKTFELVSVPTLSKNSAGIKCHSSHFASRLAAVGRMRVLQVHTCCETPAALQGRVRGMRNQPR